MKNDGGPAFPIFPDNGNHADGMSLRDYFAAKAMASLIDASEVATETFADFGEGTAQAYACKAYMMADAMLAARGQA